MSKTESTMLELGTKAPDFRLPDVVTNEMYEVSSFADQKKGLLVMFICRHCPFVIHVKSEIARLGVDYEDSGLGIVAISSNDANSHPEDAPHKLKELAQELRLRFPLLYDERQEVAKSYTAACTPDFFLFNAKRELVYRGQLDDARPGNGEPVDGHSLRAAIEALLAGQAIPDEQLPSMGCNIKWRPGNEPPYFG